MIIIKYSVPPLPWDVLNVKTNFIILSQAYLVLGAILAGVSHFLFFPVLLFFFFFVVGAKGIKK